MSKELFAIINERIERKRQKIIGHALSTPYMDTLGGQSIWVVDVLIYSDAEYLRRVPFAESGRSVRDFVNEGTPVELTRSHTGQFYIIALSDKQRGNIVKKTYNIIDAGFGYTEGWRRNTSGDWITGNENIVIPGTPEEIEYAYTTIKIIYGNLDYGTTPYGATEIVRTP